MPSAREIFEIIIDADGAKATAAFDKVSGSVKKNFGEVESKSGGFVDKLVQRIPGAQSALDKLGVSGAQAGGMIEAAIPLAAAAGGAAIAAFAIKAGADFNNLAQDVLHFKQISGTSAEDASRWVQVADDYGVATDQLSGSMGKLSQNIGKSPEKLQELGVQIAYNNDGTVDLTGTLLNVVTAYGATNDATRKAALGQAAFGKGWQSLVKLLDAGADNVKADFKGISDSLVLDDSDLATSEQFRVALDDLSDAATGLEMTLGKHVLPAMAEWVGVAADAAAAADTFFASLDGLPEPLKAVGDAFMGALDPIGKGVKDVKTIVGQFSDEIITPKLNTQALQSQMGEVTILEGIATQAKKDYDKTMADTSAADAATKAYGEHVLAIQAVSTQYGALGMAALTNRGLSDDALNEMAKSAQGFRDSMYDSFHGATGPLDEFSGKEKVTAQDFMKSLEDQKAAAGSWATNLQIAADAGINVGFIQQLAAAGPKAAPILQALVDAVAKGDTDTINRLLQDTDNLLGQGENAIINHIPEWQTQGQIIGASVADAVKSAMASLPADIAQAMAGGVQAIADAEYSWSVTGARVGKAAHDAAQSELGRSYTFPNLYNATHGGRMDVGASAAGGVTIPGRLTLVGEKGPELIVPGIQTIFPNSSLRGGGGNVSLEMNINAPIYGVDDLYGVVYGALQDVTRRAKVGVR